MSGEHAYVYYRCSGYNAPGHPRDRVREEELDRQTLSLFGRIEIQDPEVVE